MIQACRVSGSASGTASGTFTNASNIGISGYSGTGARFTGDCNVTGVAYGGTSSNSAQTSNTVTFSSITMTVSSGSSWIIAAMGDSISGNVCTPATVLSNITSATTGDISVDDTNGGVSSFASLTCTPATGSTTWISSVIEILARPSATAVPSNLYYSYSTLSNFNDTSEVWNKNGYIQLRKPAPTGSLIVINANWTFPPGCSAAASCKPTVTDDQSNTWVDDEDCSNTSQNMGQSIFHAVNVAANTQKIAFTWASTSVQSVSFHLAVLTGMATTSPVDGSASCTENQNPSGQGSINDVTAGSITTTTNGDVIWSAITSQNPSGSNGCADVISQSGYAQLSGSVTFFCDAAEMQVQANSGAINPAFSMLQIPATAMDNFGVVAIAFKTGSGGSSDSTMRILREQQDAALGAAGTQNFILPCSGSLCVMASSSGVNNSQDITATITNPNLTWTKADFSAANGGGTNGGGGFVYYAANPATADGLMMGTYTVTGASGVENALDEMDIINANTSQPDTGVTCGSSVGASGGGASLGAGTGGCYNHDLVGIASIGQTTAVTITSSQTSIPMTASVTCTNGSFASIGHGTPGGTGVEVIKITSGCGSSTLTVTRTDGTATYYYTSAQTFTGGSVWIAPLDYKTLAITPSKANGVIVLTVNNGTGPPAGIESPAVFTNPWYFAEFDNSRMGDGDGLGFVFPTNTSALTPTFIIQNGGTTGATGTTWFSGGISFLPIPPSGSCTILLLGVGKC